MENQLSISLSKNKLLKNVDISKINLSEVKGKLMTVGEGEILYREGDNTTSLYIVISGELNVIKKRLLGKTKSYLFVENDFFGHEEYIEETARTSTAVALRDSYLIALSFDEVDNLVRQDHEIFLNLREPVAEIEDDFTRLEKSAEDENEKLPEDHLKKYTFAESSADEEDDKDPIDDKKEDDFFKSIADASRSDEPNIIKPIESDEPVNSAEVFQELAFDDDENERGKDQLLEESESQPETESSGKIKEEFDESAFLNEDGIPKAEFEMPEEVTSKRKLETRELDDALFNLLSGSEQEQTENTDTSPAIESEERATTDEDFFKSLAGDVQPPEDEVTHESENDDQEFSEITKHVSTPEIEFGMNSSDAVQHYENKNDFDATPPTSNQQGQERSQAKFEEDDTKAEKFVNAEDEELQFENDNILAEAEEKLKRIERGEKIEKDSWRAITDDGGEMTSDQLRMIIKAAEAVNSTIKLDEVLRNVVEVAINLTNCDRGTLYLIDHEKHELWSMVAVGNEMKEIRLKLGEGLAGFVAKSGEIVNIKDVQNDPRFRSDFDKASGYKTQNMICYPIKNNKADIIGVLQLLNSNNGEFSKSDEEFLNAISIQSALALQNASMVEKLLQAERVQSLGKMANFLIQDIKKPVLVSKRYTEHLKGKNLSADIAQVIDMLLEQLSQVADIVQTTSNYSEGKTLLRTLNVSLNNTLADYAIRIGSYVESRNCKIIPAYDKDVTVKFDVKEFYQCYLHIVKNACDAMPEGGEIYISTKRDDKKVKIMIKDIGLGIPDGLKDKIFEPFMSYGKKEGTGLGLSITRKVIEAHNGTIDVQSVLGDGSTFIITLPVVSAF